MFSLTRLRSLLLLPLLPRLAVSDSDGGSSAAAVTNSNANAAVFVYPTDAGSDFTFALNAVDNGDLYFHMSGPAKYSWISAGIGQDMDDNLMFLMYYGNNKNTVTLSPRVAMDGTSEPTYYPAITCEQTGGTSSNQNIMSVAAVCHNATSWNGGSLDLTSADQEFMFAFGPNGKIESGSMSAPLIRHQEYGNFKLNMQQATSSGSGAVPQPNGSGQYVSANSSGADGVTSDGDYLGIIHGVVACVAYIALFPLGSLLLRLSKKIPVRLHWICQSVAAVLVVIGFGLGVAASQQYNRSRDYTDPHQIIGIVLIIAVVVQLALGAVHHVIFKKKSKSTVLGKIHLVVGPLIILLAMVNGGLGLDLALAEQSSMIAYTVVIAIFAVLLFGLRAWIQFRGPRNGTHGKLGGESNDSIPLHDGNVERGRRI